MMKFNRMLAYDTPKITRVVDRRLGLLNLFFQVIILGYLALAIYVGGAYMVEEHAVGTVVSHVKGESYTKDQHKQVRYYDYADAVFPPTETGAIFIATRILRTNLQTVAMCYNPLHKCGSKSAVPTPPATGGRRLLEANGMANKSVDLAYMAPYAYDEEVEERWLDVDRPYHIQHSHASHSGEVTGRRLLTTPNPLAGATDDPACKAKGMPKAPYGTGKCHVSGKGCVEQIWCPPEGTNDLKTLDATVAELAPFTIEFDAMLSFEALLDNPTPLRHKIPKMTLQKLLQEVGVSGGKALEAVKKTGAVINVQVWWDCNLESEKTLEACVPKVTFARLDKEEPGFSWRRATYYYTVAGERARDVQRMVGIRIKLSAYGYGRRPDILKLILQAAIGLTLLGFSVTLTDYIMLNVMEDAPLYYAYKIEESEDFGDMREKLQNLDPEEQVRLLHEKRRRAIQMRKLKKRK